MAVSARFIGLAAIATLGVAGLGYLAFGQGGDPTIDGSVAAGPVDVAQMLSFLPEEITVTYGDEAYNKGTGKTTLKDLKVTFGDVDDRGLAIGELVVAGFAGDFLQARIEGTNFDQNAVLVDHLEARNLSLFGVETFYEDTTRAYLDTINELAEGATGEDIPDIDQSLDRIDYRIEKILIDDFELLPFELVKKAGPNAISEDEAFAALQTFAAYSRAMGAKEMSMTGVSMVMDMTQDGQELSMNMQMPLTKVEGWRGGDYERSYAEGITFDISAPIPEGDNAPFEKMEMSGAIASYSVEDIRLDKAMGWLARGEMPPTTETDLMSLGMWDMQDMSFTMFGAPFYSIDSSVTDLSAFHWLVPAKVTQKTDNLVYNIGGLFETLSAEIPELKSDPELKETALKVLAVAKDYDLAAPSTDIDFNWLWEPEAGPASLSLATGLDGYGTMAFDFSGAVGGFNDWVTALEEEDVDAREEAFERFAIRKFIFNGASLKMEDRGGNERLFDMIIAVADLLKDESDEMAAIAAYDKDTLKLLVSSSIKGGAEFAAAELPAARDYANALADYITKGGTFEVALQPAEPVRFKTLRKWADIDDPEAGKAFLEQMGFRVTYEGPAGGE